MPDSLPFEIDLTTQMDLPVYTSGYAFYVNMVGKIRPGAVIRICTYNIGINVGVEFLRKLISHDMAIASSVNLLVGHNPHHLENVAIKRELSEYLRLSKNLEIALEEKQHAKFILIDNTREYGVRPNQFGWAGSLNFISPTLSDVMVELTLPQIQILTHYFDTHWSKSLAVRLVHPVNTTTPTTPCLTPPIPHKQPTSKPLPTSPALSPQPKVPLSKLFKKKKQ